MLIKREITQTVIDDLEQFPAVAILGPRQTGKTTLAKSVTQARSDTLYLDLERHSHLAQLQDAESFLSLHRDKKAAAGILDLDKLFVVVPQGNTYPIGADKVWVSPLDQLEQHLL